MSPSLYHGEFQPEDIEFVATGTIGILIFLFVFGLSVYALWLNTRRELYNVFYASMLVMCVFEFPRYFLMTMSGHYDSIAGYAAHIVSGILFFLCLAVVSYTFANILELGPYTKVIYSKFGLAVAFGVHSVIDFSAFIVCLQSQSMATFFASLSYRVYTVFDIVQNLTYSSVLVFYGMRLIYRYLITILYPT
jgi:hypothetical protein